MPTTSSRSPRASRSRIGSVTERNRADPRLLRTQTHSFARWAPWHESSVALLALADRSGLPCRDDCVARQAGQAARSRQPHDLTPEMDAEDIRLLTSANAAFAAEPYGALRGTEGDLFLSSHSVSKVLATVYAWPRARPSRRCPRRCAASCWVTVQPVFNALDLAVASRSAHLGYYDGPAFSCASCTPCGHKRIESSVVALWTFLRPSCDEARQAALDAE